MITLSIPLEPVPWAAHRGFGKRSFNPRFKEREAFQWYIKQQYTEEPITKPLKVGYEFHMPIPKFISKKARQKILDGLIRHEKKPDVTNMLKFTEDCLKGIVFVDDALVWEISACKLYAENPKVIIYIWNPYG